MFRAYLIIFVLHLCFVFQGCATSEHVELSSKAEPKEFKMTKEEMRNEMEKLKIRGLKLRRQIGILEKENQRIRDENESQMASMRDQNELLNEQVNKLKEENQRISDKNQVLTKKLAELQLKHETPSSKSYEPEKEGPEIKVMYVQKGSVRVRSGPGISHQTAGGRRLGDKVFTKDLEGDWYRIVDPEDFDKTIGWIHGSLLGEMPPGQ